MVAGLISNVREGKIITEVVPLIDNNTWPGYDGRVSARRLLPQSRRKLIDTFDLICILPRKATTDEADLELKTLKKVSVKPFYVGESLGILSGSIDRTGGPTWMKNRCFQFAKKPLIQLAPKPISRTVLSLLRYPSCDKRDEGRSLIS